MRSKKGIEKELLSIKQELTVLNQKSTKERELLIEKEKADDTSNGLFSLVKYLIDENRKTTMVLKSLTENVARLNDEIHGDLDYVEDEPEMQTQQQARELAISGLDAKIVQFIQLKGMACADDIREKMGYRGRNAASARLNKLYRQGLIERYQLGHKVYYKYDAGKATNTLIISPPQ
ncbi:MAG: winged helix-turn-helix transcriptional regulator [Candidatus Micrarchaeota archaeon]|nr:winged helix-turn-helix transcriptional regulator [Candidatus Micrarchaeota archaeon]